ncbi:MAG: hypothetical protein M0T80_10485 [Actinomycetota bacterium]|nr:hypothetical protein [Actinomycetota bacterium]
MAAGWVVLIAALWASVLALAAVVLALARRVSALGGEATAPALGPPPGTLLDAPEGATGDRAPAGRLYLFLSGGCQPCRALLDELRAADWSEVADAGVEVVVFADVELDPIAAGSVRQVVSDPGTTRTRFGVRATPYAVALDEGGWVRASRVPTSFATVVEMAVGLGSPAAGRAQH